MSTEEIVRDCWEERWLLGAILRYGATQYRPASWLEEADFVSRKHKLVWRAISELASEDESFDRVSVYRRLEAWGELGEIGHMTGLLAIEPDSPEIIKPDILAATIRRERLRREVHVTFGYLADEARLCVEKPDALLQLAEDKLQDVRDLSPSSGTETIADMVGRYPGGLEGFLKSSGILIPTPWETLRRQTGGLKRGEFWIVAARPSMGKTAWALNLALDAARNRNPIAFFSLEMSREMILKRLYAMISCTDLRDVVTGELTAVDIANIRTAQEELETLPLMVFDQKIATVAELSAAVERGMTFDGSHRVFDLVIVDYLGLLQHRNTENRNAEITAISAGLKRIAMDRKIPLVALSQLSRTLEGRSDKRPQLQDLRDSGSLEQDADVVAFLYREGYYKRDDPAEQNTAELNILKNRNGRIMQIKLYFDRQFGIFRDAA